jgi:hypothetical protein
MVPIILSQISTRQCAFHLTSIILIYLLLPQINILAGSCPDADDVLPVC